MTSSLQLINKITYICISPGAQYLNKNGEKSVHHINLYSICCFLQ